MAMLFSTWIGITLHAALSFAFLALPGIAIDAKLLDSSGLCT
jgi:hypothetical protein